MARKLALSESLVWWTRAVQARRIASMLAPRDAKLAEAYAVECEHQARAISAEGIRARNSSVRSQRAVDQPLSPFDAPHPNKLRSCVLDEPRPSSTIVEAIKRASWGEPVTSR